ncbi:Ubiquitin-conjugating enzyme E2 J1 [Galdieria sulphuraria]|uniref:Ubiquitin-conjugating enzyme n=1 Tax=Galdieria sulphuraria TaxID=130081 RepID=M2X4G5_GALSU|nr:ubiquitin-conjugating enzyme [Galdieria sulphuraria]EME31320.1 ubiquitin-conjugating enzyme [Galdieria sulphuraria]GJD07751.1 Ubiquitin-conjugating enzyme E2 J1 [Galdieria sulphuraria]|eukprot:XP_005707840.1 ubiquitin-conjugating enzyme [Galdieria sulphuraria]
MSGVGVKRLLNEYRELEKEQWEPGSWFRAYPLEEDLFEWHFTLKGPDGTPFEGGFYHGKILFPSEYPLKPPDIVMLTPNGRFETGQRICLSISSFHEETWQPSWSIRSMLLGLCSMFPCKAEGVGALNCDPEVQRRLARASLNFHCRQCHFSLSSFENQEKVVSYRSSIDEYGSSGFMKMFHRLSVRVVLTILFIALGILFMLFC